jgi:hypothetical protein
MENLNPFWWTAGLVSAWVGGICLVLTAVTGLIWLVWRSKGALIVFLAAFSCTVLVGAIFVLSLMLMERRS